MDLDWQVRFSKSAVKQYEKLKKNERISPSITDVIDLLVLEMQKWVQRELSGRILANLLKILIIAT